MIRSESGQWIPASMRSGRYEKWQERTKAGKADESDDDDDSNKPAPSMLKLLVCVFLFEKRSQVRLIAKKFYQLVKL